MLEAGKLIEEEWQVATPSGIIVIRTTIPVTERRIELAKMRRWLNHPMIQAANSVAWSREDLATRFTRIGCPERLR